MQEAIRLQKFLSQAEYCSRRKAEELIADGLVRVNGKVAVLGQRVVPDVDEVKVGSKLIRTTEHEKVVLMMNKPRGFVCSNFDPGQAQTVFELLPEDYENYKLFCVGRLDKDSEGMLIITNDGELSNRIIHPSSNIVKRYEVRLNREYDPALTPRLLKGAKVKNEKGEEEFLRFANVMRFPNDGTRLEIHLTQGRKREIRRLFEVFGFYVKELRRFQIGALILKKMSPGECRKLSKKEIDLIFAKGGNADPTKSTIIKKTRRTVLRGEKAAKPSKTLIRENHKRALEKAREEAIVQKVKAHREARRLKRADLQAAYAAGEGKNVPAKTKRTAGTKKTASAKKSAGTTGAKKRVPATKAKRVPAKKTAGARSRK
ncbi:MAG: pseudouridine synthase [Opitutales bacterium]|nr:pseudouridine synthase [Opitutales bacterium]